MGRHKQHEVDRYAKELSTECTQSMCPESGGQVNGSSDTEHSVANMEPRTQSFNTSPERKDENVASLCQIELGNILPVWTMCWQMSYRSRSG